MHVTLRWTACALAAAGLLVAACGSSGSDSDDVVTGPAAPSAADVAGSDQHLRNLAEAGAADLSGSDQHLLNLGDSGLVNPFAAGNRAAARAQADQYVEQLQSPRHRDGPGRAGTGAGQRGGVGTAGRLRRAVRRGSSSRGRTPGVGAARRDSGRWQPGTPRRGSTPPRQRGQRWSGRPGRARRPGRRRGHRAAGPPRRPGPHLRRGPVTPAVVVLLVVAYILAELYDHRRG
jgi:hypothetical protein